MPGKVKVRIVAGRNLPVMDRSSDTTDAYVEVKLGSTTHKTDVYRKSLNPQWNSEWFRFEVDDLELQDEPLQVRLMDHDTYSANDAIGKVYIDLNPLLLAPISSNLPNKQVDSSQGTTVMSGWLPVYDTMHGIRGEVNIIVKVDLFSDFNKFRQSSCGVHFFFTPEIPSGYRCQSVLGFVEELVVNDDPEYQWIDKIRTPRASNEARQTLFFKLSGELQRRIGLKVLDLGGNAAIGYKQCFDLEEESGIVVRGIASVVNLVRINSEIYTIPPPFGGTHSPSPHRELPSHRESSDQVPDTRTSLSSCGSPKRTSSSRSRHTSGCYSMSRSPQPSELDTSGTPTLPSQSPTQSAKNSSPARTPGVTINRRSSDSDLSLTPKGGSLTGSGGSSGGKGGLTQLGSSPHRPIMTQESFEMLEYPFLSMKTFPSGFLLHFGGSVSARSVKLLDRGHTTEEIETRDSWWAQLRSEIRSHARALRCNVVIGYEEYTTMCDEVCVLNAQGTAAVIRLQPSEGGDVLNQRGRDIMISSLEKTKDTDHTSRSTRDAPAGMTRSHPSFSDDVLSEGSASGAGTFCNSAPPISLCKPPTSTVHPCTMCHIPYSETSLPFKVKISRCAVCRKGKVADVLFTTVELPTNLPILGRGCLIQARVARTKREMKGELNAKEISDSLPFLEYELHKQLINKMKVKGMNSLFSLRVRVTVGERLVVGVATATAVYVTALPAPHLPRVTTAGCGKDEERRRLDAQKLLQDTLNQNKLTYGLNQDISDDLSSTKDSDSEDSEEEAGDVDFSLGNKDACLLELDDMEDAEMISQLVEGSSPNQLMATTTQIPPGIPTDQIVTNLQMFTKIWRAKIPVNPNQSTFNHYFDRLLQSVMFRLRKLKPCYLTGVKFDVEIPEEDELQIALLGMVLGQGAVSLKNNIPNNDTSTVSEVENRHKQRSSYDGDMIFKLEELGPTEEYSSVAQISCYVNQKPNKAVQAIKGAFEASIPAKFQTTSSVPSFASVPSNNSFPSVQSVVSMPSASSFSSECSSARSSFKHRPDKKPVTYYTSPTGDRFGVEITPLSFIPGSRIDKHLGNLNFFFIRESTSIKEVGGLSGFIGSFVTEVLALIRAHVAALGGNAMISYFMNECVLLHNPHKNQGQCLMNVGGDVVQVSYYTPPTEGSLRAEE